MIHTYIIYTTEHFEMSTLTLHKIADSSILIVCLYFLIQSKEYRVLLYPDGCIHIEQYTYMFVGCCSWCVPVLWCARQRVSTIDYKLYTAGDYLCICIFIQSSISYCFEATRTAVYWLLYTTIHYLVLYTLQRQQFDIIWIYCCCTWMSYGGAVGTAVCGMIRLLQYNFLWYHERNYAPVVQGGVYYCCCCNKMIWSLHTPDRR